LKTTSPERSFRASNFPDKKFIKLLQKKEILKIILIFNFYNLQQFHFQHFSILNGASNLILKQKNKL